MESIIHCQLGNSARSLNADLYKDFLLKITFAIVVDFILKKHFILLIAVLRQWYFYAEITASVFVHECLANTKRLKIYIWFCLFINSLFTYFICFVFLFYLLPVIHIFIYFTIILSISMSFYIH